VPHSPPRRRLEGLVWYAVFSHGTIGKLDPATGQMKEYRIPAAFSQPYDVWPDREDNIWVSDAGMGGSLIRFDPRAEKFTFYPSPQRGDMPKSRSRATAPSGTTPARR